VLTHWIASKLSSANQSLESHSQLLSLFPGTTGSYLRVAFYRRTIQYCDPTATICFGTLLSKTGAEIHRNVYVGPRCMLGLVTLEQDVLLGPAVQIPSGPKTHGIESLTTPIRQQPGEMKRVTIGTNSWIGASSIVLADVQDGTIVGAASVVSKTLPAKSVIAGNPARVLRDRMSFVVAPGSHEATANTTPDETAIADDCSRQKSLTEFLRK